MTGLVANRRIGFFFFARVRVYRVAALLATLSLFSLSLTFAAAEDTAINDLKAVDRKRKFQAIEKLRAYPTQRTQQALATILASETDVHAQLAILDTISTQANPAQVAVVRSLLKSPVPAVRQRAAQTLGRLAGPESEQALAQALRSERQTSVRIAVIESLSLCGSQASVSDLQSALGDKNADVRANAADALRRIPGKEANNALKDRAESDPRVRRVINEAIRSKEQETR